ncbi:hypothetical protein F8M41_006912 [Gigaspora margarita]|uniref:Uncharacterized protein n=1 Tax=Gigaspora margarita TaxID=4874 RepID=A0A8H4A3E0_GIGMA|nr:hypothetical protein F8M41_006912 [Gigaspora margarita]
MLDYLKNLNKFDASVREQELKKAFVTEKNKYNEKIKVLKKENTYLKNQLSANQNKIVKLENEVTRLTDNIEQMELDYICQKDQMKNEIKSKTIKINKIEIEIEKLEKDNLLLMSQKKQEKEIIELSSDKDIPDKMVMRLREDYTILKQIANKKETKSNYFCMD